jgi:hypothetical protein
MVSIIPKQLQQKAMLRMMGLVDRAIDDSRASGRFGDNMAQALKSEARGRVEAGTFFRHIAYVTLVARKLT